MRISDIRYDKHLSNAGFSSVNDVITDKNEKKHEVLLDAALDKLWKSEEYDWTEIYSQDDLDIIEHRNQSYKKAPVCIFRTKRFPYKQWKVDMSKWWSNAYITHYDDMSTINFANYEDKDNMIVSANYVNGKVRTESDINDTYQYISFDRVNGEAPIDANKFYKTDTITNINI